MADAPHGGSAASRDLAALRGARTCGWLAKKSGKSLPQAASRVAPGPSCLWAEVIGMPFPDQRASGNRLMSRPTRPTVGVRRA